MSFRYSDDNARSGTNAANNIRTPAAANPSPTRKLCGENRIDCLVWLVDDYEQVECANCGTVYEPGEGASNVPQELVAEVIALERLGEKYAAREDGRPKGA